MTVDIQRTEAALPTTSLARKFNRGLRRFVAQHPAIYIPLRRRKMAHTIATAETQLLIEGFPRSGNTFTEAAVRYCAPENLRLAHHSHAPAHVRHALSLGVPALVLFREPDAAVRSYMVLYGNSFGAREAYLDYIAFYSALGGLRDPLLAFYSFEDVTTRIGDVISDLNHRFALGLEEREIDSDAVFELMNRKAKKKNSPAFNTSRSHPGNKSEERRAMEGIAQRAIDAPELRMLRARARDLYNGLRSSLEPK